MPVSNKIPNHDLLDQIRICILEARQIYHGTYKVVSHQNFCLLDFDEKWVCNGNNAADAVAGKVFSEYPHLLIVQQQLKQEIQELCTMRFWVHKVLIRTGQLAMDKLREERRRNTEDETQVVLARREITDHPTWTFPLVLEDKFRKYNIPEWHTIATWVQSLQQGGEQLYLSWYQLYADFHIQFPSLGPWYKSSSKRWFGGDTRPTCGFAKGSRWMADFLTRLGRQLGTPVPSKLQRPDSHVITFWTCCLPVKMPTERYLALERWLADRRACYRQPKDFEYGDD